MTGRARGGFVTFEGGEGTGKSTQGRLLAERIGEAGHEAVATREPGGSPRAERIRAALLSGAIAPLGPAAEAMMFAAARLDHLDAVIRPALARGAYVVCDRFVDSTRVYQGLLAGVAPALLAGLEALVVGPTMPDLTIVLDLDAATGLGRAAARREAGQRADRFEREAEGFHEGLRHGFLAIADREPDRCLVLDASRPPQEIARTIWLIVQARFPGLKRSASGTPRDDDADRPS